MSAPVIDVSEFNGSINWAAAAGHISGAIIRLGYRGYNANGRIVYDKQYAANRNGCTKHGIPWSLYFFPTSITDAEAIEEADFIVDNARGMAFPFPVFLDSELSHPQGRGRSDHLSRAQRTRMLRLICERCQAAGIPMGIYGSTSWLQGRLDMAGLPYSVWCAQYAARCTYKGHYRLWQFTSAGAVPGISGRVDLNRVVAEISPPVPAPAPVFTAGKTYTLRVELRVRYGPGTQYKAKSHSELTSGGRQHDADHDGALDPGTRVTCLESRQDGLDVWIRIPSGWIAALYKGKQYVE